MIEADLQIPMADGMADAILYRHEDGRPRPGILYYPDAIGIRPAFRGMARRVAEAGYTVLMPNVHYRSGRPPLFEFEVNFAEPRTRTRFGELTAPLTPEAIERDASSYVDFLAGQPGVKEGPMGVVGYCFTGKMAVRTAAVRADRIVAAASFHGGWLYTGDETSSHLALPRVRARLYFGHASQDGSMPAGAIASLEGALEAWGGRYQSELYEGALHGWTVPGGQVYHEAQAERAFGKLMELLGEELG